jgi:hypothetical protein
MESQNARNNDSGELWDKEKSKNLESLSLAAALSNFQDKLVAGEMPNPDDLLAEYPEDSAELEEVLFLLYWGKAVLSPGASDGVNAVEPDQDS